MAKPIPLPERSDLKFECSKKKSVTGWIQVKIFYYTIFRKIFYFQNINQYLYNNWGHIFLSLHETILLIKKKKKESKTRKYVLQFL